MNFSSAKIWLEVQALRLRNVVRVPVFLITVGLFLFSFYMFMTQNTAYFGYKLPDIVIGDLALQGVMATVVIGFVGMLISALLAYKVS